jgi:hypothetical protein
MGFPTEFSGCKVPFPLPEEKNDLFPTEFLLLYLDKTGVYAVNLDGFWRREV